MVQTQSANLVYGSTVRQLRERLGLSQKLMAQKLDITPSYLNQIEHNKRPLSADLIIRLADTFNVDARTFSAAPRLRAFDLLREISNHETLKHYRFQIEELREVAFASPNIAEALYNAIQRHDGAEGKLAIDGESPIVSREAMGPSGSNHPANVNAKIDALFRESSNQFGDLDDVAGDYAHELGLTAINRVSVLMAHLSSRHGVKVEKGTEDESQGSVAWRDRYRNVILYDPRADSIELQWHLLIHCISLDHASFIQSKVQETGPWSESGRSIARDRFTEYFALACLMPYGEIFAEAERKLYDLDYLRLYFGVSFEQLALRLCSLQKEEKAAPPFFFFKIDCAGNTKRFLAHDSFATTIPDSPCPLMYIHNCFRTPDTLLTQVFEFPDGRRFFLLAKQMLVAYTQWPVRVANTAICIGVQIEHAHRLVYANGTNFGTALPTFGGLSCSTCQRENCASRAKRFG